MVCLDTTFLIDVIHGEKKVEELEDELDNGSNKIFITSLSIAELIKGLNLKKNSIFVNTKEKEKIKYFISEIDILSFDKESAIIAGEIEADLINHGEIIGVEDIMIASICIKNNERLITRNKKHFEKIKDLKIKSY